MVTATDEEYRFVGFRAWWHLSTQWPAAFLGCLTAIPTGLSHGALRFLQLGIEQTVRHEAGSAVPGCFLRELYAGGESEFGVDVGEVGLHGAR